MNTPKTLIIIAAVASLVLIVDLLINMDIGDSLSWLSGAGR